MVTNSATCTGKVEEKNAVTLKTPEVTPVQSLPQSPQEQNHYVFSNVSRHDVTEFNHGLHKYPAKFIPHLPRWALIYGSDSPIKTVLDPFCGSGTTLVEAGLKGHHAIGYDINPLAVLISQAKATIFTTYIDPESILEKILLEAKKNAKKTLRELVENEECLGLHETWSFWFRPAEMARLLGLKQAILKCFSNEKDEVKNFLLACLSSISKASSYLNEDQIKVRYDSNKEPLDPFVSFARFTKQSLERQYILSDKLSSIKASFSIQTGSSTQLYLPSSSVDRIITSPPYINAIDYTMAHKYNLFILGLIQPSNFKEHCRSYIGMTERAVRAADLRQMPKTGILIVDQQIEKIWLLNTPVSRNRAFIVWQYFDGMYASLKEMFRTLRSGGKAIVVIGNTNRICGIEVETAKTVQHLALLSGLETELHFYHHLANRSSMRLNRGVTGGTIKFESVYVFNRP